VGHLAMKSMAAIFQPEGRPLHPGYRPDIDGLRAVAILSVLSFHAWPKALQGGFVGVDVFFVISGYLITGIIAGNIDAGNFRLRDFYGRRVRRIFPALVLVLAATLALGGLILFPVEYGQLGWHTVVAGLFSSNLQLWSETGYFDPGSETKPLLHLWSLGIEEQFYLLWPLLLVVIARWGRGHRSWLVAALGLASFAFNMGLYKFYNTAAFYMPFTRFWELLIGAFLAVMPDGWITALLLRRPFARVPLLARAWPQLASILGLLVIGLSVLHSYPGIRALAPTLGAALIIAAGPAAWLNRHVLASRPAVYVGLISYPLYLWHWPLLSFLHIAELEDADAVRVLTLGVLFLSFLLAALTYHVLERRLRHAPLRKVMPPLLAAMVAVMLAGAAVLLLKGLPQRFDTRDRAMIGYVTQEQDGKGAVFRQRICFLDLDQDEKAFAAACAASAPTLFLWGDSHAAHLYSGLSVLTSQLSQYTATECPPALDFRPTFESNEHCVGINRAVLARLATQKPKVVILAGYWPLYFREPGFAEALSHTIVEAKRHARAVVLVGPATSYPGPQLRRAVRLAGTDMLRDEKLPDLHASDALLRSIAAQHKVAYVSPVSALCVQDACRVIVPGSQTHLFAFDYGHLTRAGSDYYARTLIAPALPRP
jgi:peptidoglycan/LPS O-acetylase OafA/YrhL